MIEQGSPEWFQMRCGKVTASRIVDVMAKPRKPGEGMRVNYRTQLVVERMTGVPMKTYQNDVMEEGGQWEDKARAAYAFRTDAVITKIAFVEHPTIAMAGCSPDGYVNADGMVQIKCPYAATHLRTIRDEAIPDKYMKQMYWELACNPTRQWCDYVSYNDDMPERMRLYVKRVPRDSGIIGDLEAAVRQFQTEIDLELSVYRERGLL